MPRISEDRKSEVIATFQASFKRDNRPDVEAIPLSELRDTDEMTGDRDINAGFRIALKNRIRDLEAAASLTEQRKYESKIRALNLVVGVVAGIVITVVATWLTK